MLVLSRKVDQEIKIGDDITIKVVKVQGKSVRLGIAAPREVRVVRAELPKEEDTIDGKDGSGKVSLDMDDGAGKEAGDGSRNRQGDGVGSDARDHAAAIPNTGDTGAAQ